MKPSRVVTAGTLAFWAGAAQSAVVEKPALVLAGTPPVITAPTDAAPGSDLVLWRNLGTAFDEADALMVPGPALPGKTVQDLPGKTVQDTVLDADLFGTVPARPALP